MEEQVLLLQQLYPRIYAACHTNHVHAASSPVRLSARDSSLLAHFRGPDGLLPSELARHLGVARSTMSAAVKKLVALGYLTAEKRAEDRRHTPLRLTGQGMKAMQAASVLDSAKVGQLLNQLSPAERKQGLAGLALLAKGAEAAMLKSARNGGEFTRKGETMKWLILCPIGFLCLFVLIAVVGALLPQNHVATRSATFAASPVVVWDAITNVSALPEWRAGVVKVEILPAQSGLKWRESGSHRAITYEVVEAQPPSKWVTRIADPTLPFGGTWTYNLSPSANGCVLTITENGQVRNVFFRFISRFVIGHTATIDAYLKALGKKLGEDVVTPPNS